MDRESVSTTAIKRIRRGILSALRPLQGIASSGTIFARSSSGAGTIELPKNCHLVPIIGSATGRGEISHDLPLRVTATVDVEEGGTSVAVASVLGGPRNNLAAGTRLRFDPPLVGLEDEATVEAPGLTGGELVTSGPGIVRDIRPFETLESLEVARDLFAGEVADLPAAIVAYGGSSEIEPVGEATILEAHRWRIYVVTQWGANAQATGNEATDILGAIKGLLVRRTSSHGLVFSSPPASLVGVSRVRVSPTVFVWAIDLTTYMGLQRTDFRPAEGGGDGVSYADWLVDSYTLSTFTAAQPMDLPVVDASYDHATGPVDPGPVVPDD